MYSVSVPVMLSNVVRRDREAVLAQDRAKALLEGYIKNIGSAIGKEYTVVWQNIEAPAATTAE